MLLFASTSYSFSTFNKVSRNVWYWLYTGFRDEKSHVNRNPTSLGATSSSHKLKQTRFDDNRDKLFPSNFQFCFPTLLKPKPLDNRG